MEKLAVGLMSGTSGDGVSLALCSFNGHRFRILHYQTFGYPAALRNEILRGKELRTPEISRLNVSLGIFFAEKIKTFVRRAKISPSHITVVGSHGQTIYHGPNDRPRNTFQIGEPSFISEATGIPVISDFRVRDIASGGEGAPLIPFFDQYFFGSRRPRAMQNIGGIANVTLVAGPKIIAFDNGPGNCLIDETVQKLSRGKMNFDRNGKWASQGKVDRKAVRQMAAHPYFRKEPPKSTGRELFNGKFLGKISELKPADQIATLTYFTAYTIAESYKKFLPKSLSEIIVSGGGALNRTLMKHLQELCAPVRVRSIEDWGIPAQAKEPVAFAFFALQAIEGKINHLPSATGARKAVILGKITPASPDSPGTRRTEDSASHKSEKAKKIKRVIQKVFSFS